MIGLRAGCLILILFLFSEPLLSGPKESTSRVPDKGLVIAKDLQKIVGAALEKNTATKIPMLAAPVQAWLEIGVGGSVERSLSFTVNTADGQFVSRIYWDETIESTIGQMSRSTRLIDSYLFIPNGQTCGSGWRCSGFYVFSIKEQVRFLGYLSEGGGGWRDIPYRAGKFGNLFGGLEDLNFLPHGGCPSFDLVLMDTGTSLAVDAPATWVANEEQRTRALAVPLRRLPRLEVSTEATEATSKLLAYTALSKLVGRKAEMLDGLRRAKLVLPAETYKDVLKKLKHVKRGDAFAECYECYLGERKLWTERADAY